MLFRSTSADGRAQVTLDDVTNEEKAREKAAKRLVKAHRLGVRGLRGLAFGYGSGSGSGSGRKRKGEKVKEAEMIDTRGGGTGGTGGIAVPPQRSGQVEDENEIEKDTNHQAHSWRGAFSKIRNARAFTSRSARPDDETQVPDADVENSGAGASTGGANARPALGATTGVLSALLALYEGGRTGADSEVSSFEGTEYTDTPSRSGSRTPENFSGREREREREKAAAIAAAWRRPVPGISVTGTGMGRKNTAYAQHQRAVSEPPPGLGLSVTEEGEGEGEDAALEPPHPFFAQEEKLALSPTSTRVNGNENGPGPENGVLHPMQHNDQSQQQSPPTKRSTTSSPPNSRPKSQYTLPIPGLSRIPSVPLPPLKKPTLPPLPNLQNISNLPIFNQENRRPAQARSAGGVFGALIAGAGNLSGVAAPAPSAVAPDVKRPGWHLSRYSLSDDAMPISSGGYRYKGSRSAPGTPPRTSLGHGDVEDEGRMSVGSGSGSGSGGSEDHSQGVSPLSFVPQSQRQGGIPVRPGLPRSGTDPGTGITRSSMGVTVGSSLTGNNTSSSGIPSSGGGGTGTGTGARRRFTGILKDFPRSYSIGSLSGWTPDAFGLGSGRGTPDTVSEAGDYWDEKHSRRWSAFGGSNNNHGGGEEKEKERKKRKRKKAEIYVCVFCILQV